LAITPGEKFSITTSLTAILQHGSRLRPLEIDAQAQLAAVDVLEHRVLLGILLRTDDGASLAHVIERTPAFDLDHFGAHVGQNVSGDRAGPDPAEIDHPQPR
jgi:hypothetical protein